MSHVKIRYRKNGNVWDCPVDALDYWLSIGWSKAADSAELTNDQAAVSAPETPKK